MIELKLQSDYGSEQMTVKTNEMGNIEIEILNYKDGEHTRTKYELDGDERAQLKIILDIL